MTSCIVISEHIAYAAEVERPRPHDFFSTVFWQSRGPQMSSHSFGVAQQILQPKFNCPAIVVRTVQINCHKLKSMLFDCLQ